MVIRVTLHKTYTATIYEDGKNASFDKNPQSYNIRKIKVKKGSKLSITSSRGGGYAISIIPNA